VKSPLFLSFLLSSLPMISVFGEEGSKGGQVNAKKRPMRPDLIKRYDLNRDHQLSREEFNQGQRVQKLDDEVKTKLFDRLDKNRDGFITPGELPTLSGAQVGRAPLSQADANKDGGVSYEEFTKASRFKVISPDRLKAMFQHFDRNGDGVLDKQDHPADRHVWRRPFPRIVFAELDSNQDKKLSFDEFLKASSLNLEQKGANRWLFERIDLDQDHLISPQELKLARERERRGRLESQGARDQKANQPGFKK